MTYEELRRTFLRWGNFYPESKMTLPEILKEMKRKNFNYYTPWYLVEIMVKYIEEHNMKELMGPRICLSGDDLQNDCWVCNEFICIGVGRVKIEFTHITKELGEGEFRFCPRCGRRI